MKKPGRNDACSCGSGKKFKKCCELKEGSKQLKAERIQQVGSFASASRITQFFQSHLPPSSALPPSEASSTELDEKKESL